VPAGAVIHLIATDPAAPLDLPACCHLTGHTYLGGVLGGCPVYGVQAAGAAVPMTMSMVATNCLTCSSGSPANR
jgi:hypothetical protein